MKKIYTLIMMVAMAFSAMASAPMKVQGDVSYYDGDLNIKMEMLGLDINQEARVSLEECAENAFKFTLPNFSITLGVDPLPLGNIVVENVVYADENADGRIEISGSVEGMSLAGGEIIADVTLSGTEDENGVMDLTIDVEWDNAGTMIPIAVTFNGSKNAYKGWVDYYSGDLNIKMEMLGLDINQEARVSLEEYAENTFKFTLPDFSIVLQEGADPLPLGDIVVEDVAYADENADGKIEISGSVEGMSLAGGEIIADVTLAGTEDENGLIDLTIDVEWDNEGTMIPIAVTFKGQKEIVEGSVQPAVAESNVNVYGIAGAAAVNGFAGTVYVYSLDGRLVKTARVDGSAEVSLAKGVYILRAGAKAQKVLVK